MASIEQKTECYPASDKELIMLNWVSEYDEPGRNCRPPIPEDMYLSRSKESRKGYSKFEIKRLIESEVDRRMQEYEPLLKRMKEEGEAFERNVQFMNKIMKTSAKKNKKKKKAKSSDAPRRFFDTSEEFDEYLKNCE